MPALPRAVLFDFSGTLFHIEDAQAAVVAALGEQYAHIAPDLKRWGAINGSGTPAELPDDLAEVWAGRDLSCGAHRAAYSGLSVRAGLTPEQADLVYERGITAAAWAPYPDTIDVLQRLRAAAVQVALVSNIGWDPRCVLHAYGATRLIDVLALSDELGVMKPGPGIFTHACDALGVAPRDALMIGDTAETDGGAVAIGCAFRLIASAASRPPDTLLRAVGF